MWCRLPGVAFIDGWLPNRGPLPNAEAVGPAVFVFKYAPPLPAVPGGAGLPLYALCHAGSRMTETTADDILTAVQHLQRISNNPDVMGGKACIRGMRVTVGMIVGALAAGRTIADLLADFAYLREEGIRQALAYAAELAQGREFSLAS